MRLRYRLTGLVLIGLLMAACGTGSATTSEPDRIATGVAEAKAVAATLTAEAPTAAPAPGPATVGTAPEPPTPTDTPEPQRADPFVPGGGDPKDLIGKMLLPGYGGPSEQVDLPVFNEQIVFRLFVYDPSFANEDGAGINSVDIQITDFNGQVVESRTEQAAAYCAFGGGEPDCTIWKFAEHGNEWPNGLPVCSGRGYEASMTVDAKNDNNDGALWRFSFGIDGDYPPCP